MRERLVHSALELMAHPLDATAPQVDVVDSLRKHWAFDLDDPDNAFGDTFVLTLRGSSPAGPAYSA